MVSSRRSLTVLAVVVLFLVAVPVSGVAALSPAEALSGSSTDPGLSGTDDTRNETTDDTLDETAEETDDTRNETGDGSIDGTTNDTEQVVNETTEDADETVNETVDDGTEAVGGTVDKASQESEETADDAEEAINGTVSEAETTVQETADSVERTAKGTVPESLGEAAETTASGIEKSIEEVGQRSESGTLTPSDSADLLEAGTAPSDAILDPAAETALGGDGETTKRAGAGETDVASSAMAPSSPAGGQEASEQSEDDSTGSSGVLPGGDAGTGVAVGTALVGAALLARSVGAAAGLSGAAGASSSLLASITALLRGWLQRLLLLIGYKRYSNDDPLEHETRERLYRQIRATPGSYLSEISEQADVPMQTARYHLRILEFENLVTHESIRGRRRYVPAGTDWAELEAALNDEATAAVIEALDRHGPDSVSGLAETLGRDPSTISHHLDRLAADGLVARERDGRAVTNKLTPGVAAALEGEIEATASRVPSQAD